ncbi:rhodanese-like domain-containing protein [Nocardioides sp. CFH 31398]|uniref:rhodanese-like domain-containing protein n=1 Tax=Nocardioides sp. CFH 31398 TaxID=2919579 RepID=UPI001F05A254|nr:rhodanese-like domain-containing protein [Nocardioides sp. CFH 31398]MCH1865516.1 rhodanese-like domain-containing protein [Nocardioides sp. CFH 31398]
MTPTTLDPTDLRDLLDRPDAPLVLDVRTPAEFESAHVPGSWNLPLDLLREHRRDLVDRLDHVDIRDVLATLDGGV